MPGLIAVRDEPRRRVALARAARRGEIHRLLPGIYAPGDSLQWRLAAVALWRADAVICGAAAARLTYLPQRPVTSIDVAVRTAAKAPGYRFNRCAVPPEYVLQSAGLRLTTPAWTALDLVSTDGGDAIDEALRSRAVRLPELWDAFRAGSGRAGNRERLRLLIDSRDGAWSTAERLAHRLLRRHRITGWRANWPVGVGGRRYYLDLAFPELRLVVEIAGYAHHGPDRFESDRQRQNDLVLAGWTVLRITWRMLTEEPHEVIARITAAMSQTRRDQHPNPRIRRA